MNMKTSAQMLPPYGIPAQYQPQPKTYLPRSLSDYDRQTQIQSQGTPLADLLTGNFCSSPLELDDNQIFIAELPSHPISFATHNESSPPMEPEQSSHELHPDPQHQPFSHLSTVPEPPEMLTSLSEAALATVWFKFSKEFGQRTNDPVRAIDAGVALHYGMDEMWGVLAGREPRGGIHYICFLHLSRAMAGHYEAEIPPAIVADLDAKLVTIHVNATAHGTYEACETTAVTSPCQVAVYFLDGE